MLMTRLQSLNCFRALKSYSIKLYFNDKKKQKNKGFVMVVVEKTFRRAKKTRGKKTYTYLLKTKFKINNHCLSFYNYKKNDSVFLKKRMTPRGKIVKGTVPFLVKKKKFISPFHCIVKCLNHLYIF